MGNVTRLRPDKRDARRPVAWWMRWPRERLTLVTLLASLAFWIVVLPAIGVF